MLNKPYKKKMDCLRISVILRRYFLTRYFILCPQMKKEHYALCVYFIYMFVVAVKSRHNTVF